jgi:hypothetical protein
MILGCQPPALGDKDAYERFREYEAKHRKFIESGRAINAVLFADEMARSPASDLYSAMRHVVADRAISSTGGFVCVVSNRPEGFRYSVFSDMLFNWPEGESADFILDLNHQIDFGTSGENADYAVCQISERASRSPQKRNRLRRGHRRRRQSGSNPKARRCSTSGTRSGAVCARRRRSLPT